MTNVTQTNETRKYPKNGIVSLMGGHPVTTTVDIAEGTMNDHASVLKLVRAYLPQLEAFGRVGFEIEPFETAGGIQNREIGWLNESQATLLIAFMRNNPVVVGFKVRLVTAFAYLAGKNQVVEFKVPQTLSEALRLAADLSDENIAHKATIATLEPKAAFSDRVALATDGQSVAEVAKILGTGQNRLYQWLRGKKFIMADNLPYQEHLDCGRFRVIEQTWEGKTSMHTSTKTLITGKGLIWLQKAWDEENAKAVA